MKNIQPLITRRQAHDFLRGLWRTAAFARSHDDPNGFLRGIVERFADTPAFFFELTDPALETSHFSAWWGGIQLREGAYDNDAIHDLYYLHEIYHKGTMPYCSGLAFPAFAAKMQRNELEASVCSEIAAYFALPGLREQAFAHPIYADRLLRDRSHHESWAADPVRAIERFRVLRHDVLHKQMPTDQAEYWIRQYAAQNEAWARIWRSRYDEVEAAMVALEQRCRRHGREPALFAHLDWLRSEAICGGGNIPFPQEARRFAEVYWANKRAYRQAHGKRAA